jgi:hypothetical protein
VAATTGNYYCCKRLWLLLQLVASAATSGGGDAFGCPALVLWAHHVLLLWVAGVATLVRRICYFGQPELLPNFLEALLPAAALFMPWVAGVAAKFYARYCQDKLMLRPGGG